VFERGVVDGKARMVVEVAAGARIRPRGYTGIDHQTIGSDILSILSVIPVMPETTLGKDLFERLRAVKMDGWYPIGLLLEAMDRLDERVGRFGLMMMGRKLFEMSHAEQFKKVAHSAADVVHGIDAMYHRANRGQGIGGWEVIRFEPGYAELVKTTPHHCVMEEGIVSEALRTLGIPTMVQQRDCLRQGADHCRYILQSPINDDQWMGGRSVVR
jgi:hypothetical protein